MVLRQFGLMFSVLPKLICMSVQVETSSGRLMPAYFEPEARCPDGTVRGVQTTTVSADPKWVATLVSPYDTLSDTFKISPFKWYLSRPTSSMIFLFD